MPPQPTAAPNIAIYCDFENVALGVKDAKLREFDVSVVLERLLDKGNIVVKKAYADWQRFSNAKKPLHEAGFEMIEIPHVRMSGKNSADIRLVVDALDLCYTKGHVALFVIVSGDSDFSPLVAKLRENNKTVIGVGVKQSTSDLLVDSCDEFIYYDDLVQNDRETTSGSAPSKARRPRSGPRGTKPAKDDPKREGLDLVVAQAEALFREREDNVWGSMVKQTLKRKRPNFSESQYGYRTFNELLEDAEQRGLLELEKDERSGGYLILRLGPPSDD